MAEHGRLIDADQIRYEPMLSARGNGQYDEVMVAFKDQIDDLPTIEPEPKMDDRTCTDCKYEDYFDYQQPCKKCIRIASCGRDGDYFALRQEGETE